MSGDVIHGCPWQLATYATTLWWPSSVKSLHLFPLDAFTLLVFVCMCVGVLFNIVFHCTFLRLLLLSFCSFFEINALKHSTHSTMKSWRKTRANAVRPGTKCKVWKLPTAKTFLPFHPVFFFAVSHYTTFLVLFWTTWTILFKANGSSQNVAKPATGQATTKQLSMKVLPLLPFQFSCTVGPAASRMLDPKPRSSSHRIRPLLFSETQTMSKWNASPRWWPWISGKTQGNGSEPSSTFAWMFQVEEFFLWKKSQHTWCCFVLMAQENRSTVEAGKVQLGVCYLFIWL